MNFGLVDSDSGILRVSDNHVEHAQLPKLPVNGFSGHASSASRFLAKAPTTTIIKKKKRPVTFERRFLSARGRSDACKLEVAMVWRDTVLSIDQFDAKNGRTVTVGSDPKCNYKLAVDNACNIALAECVGNTWELIFNNAYDGFILVGETKTAFKDASSADFITPASHELLSPGSLACEVNGQTRAKFVFGEVTILVRFVDTVAYGTTGFSLASSNFSGLVASLLIHFALFSVILFATSRADALMVDRIMSNSRFATIEELTAEDEPEPDMVEEVVAVDETPDETDNSITKDASKTSFAPNSGNSDSMDKGSGISKGQAVGMAMQQGLLNQATEMNSMLAAAAAINMDNLEWSTFDPNGQMLAGNYLLGAGGTQGGANGLGVMGASGFGPNGGKNGGVVGKASTEYKAGLGDHKERAVPVKPGKLIVEGTIDKRIIQKVVRDHQGEFRACYERELNKIKGLNGRVVLFWLISPQGDVTKTIVKETSLKNQTVEQCLIKSVNHWRFPAPKGGGIVGVEYPFVFNAGSNN
ncbi:MAG: AgmX/PglI C-terminal domain-containing protein [Proteobacteria bacterium]|nr:AgmX/PglI C-terminal domain-containing protein [Pseudomonadota bacterium]